MTVRPYIKEILQNLIIKLSKETVQLNKDLVNVSKIKLKWSDVVADNKKQNQASKIPTIITSQTFSVNKTIEQKSKQTTDQPMRLKSANETNVESKKKQHKVILVGDSHARGCVD